MKNNAVFQSIFILLGLMAGLESCKDKCDQNVSITAVQPNTNPSGYEVLLKTSGFSDNVKVIFGSVEASSRPGGEAGDIIATVPDGLSGNVEVSVEEGACIGRSGDFIVSGTLPGNVQPSLPEIIVPVPTTFPGGNIINGWINATDASGFTYGIHISGQLVAGFSSLEDSYEFNFDDPKFNNNPATGTMNINTNVIYLEVDRTANGGILEHFDGQFIEKPDFLPASSKPPILLVSRESGRQLLLYYPD